MIFGDGGLRFISRAIVGGKEVCPECFVRGHFDDENGQREDYSTRLPETYTHVTNDMAGRTVYECEFDVVKARELIAARPRAVTIMPVEALAEWTQTSNVTWEHIDHLPPEVRRRPGIVVFQLRRGTVTDLDTGEFIREVVVPMPIVIDGSHRGAGCLRDGEPFYVSLLTAAEARQVTTYKEDGGVVKPLPDDVAGTFPADHEVGLL